MKIIIRQDRKGEFYALLIARNGKVVWKTPDGYKSKQGVMKAVMIIGFYESSTNTVLINSKIVEIIDETKKSK